MKRLNFQIQSTLLTVALILSIASIFRIGDSFFWLLMLQLFTGIVQTVVAIKMFSVKSTRTVFLKIYLVISIVFLLVFFMGMEELMEMFKFGFVIIPWTLAALFWFVSFQACKINKK